ncbi:hypothetical protein [Leptospira yasudae]|uniref:Serine protease n=1 Tax=Leptospira yasudae TaxID=2202201 RepID=A0A6N4QFG0_9LEPT|nr:hypothetical protein [Leptospira yasudae]TGL75983.1 hypothetical protein EHQ72_14435 [Leptospira yasudae]TGL79745.1 hypothetical protein EHQ83_17915 [Leptospira yasudae]TGL80099.1 hypothetical protein EHQ77_08950 [Leptospira yasudae]
MLINLKEHIRDTIHLAGRSVDKSIIPIFDIQNEKAVHFGSGILLELSNRKFIISASHVLIDDNPKICIPIKRKIVNINGEIRGTRLPKSNDRTDDRIDIAFMELDKESAAEIENEYIFLRSSDLGLSLDINTPNVFFIYGYPCTKVKKREDIKEIKAQPFLYFDTNKNITALEFQKTGTNPDFHVLIRYEKKTLQTLDGIRQVGPKLNGMSGCGLWCVPSFLTDPNNYVNRVLAGILIEYFAKDMKILVSTRIDLVIEAMRQTLALDVSLTKFVNLKFDSD